MSTIMKNSGRVGYWLVGIAASIMALVAITIAVGVIPAVKTDPLAMTAPAVPALWANVVASLLISLVLIGILFAKVKGVHIPYLLLLIGLGPICLGFFLLDAAFAFSRHGSEMQGVTLTLFICVAGEVVAGLLTMIETRVST